MAIMAISIFPDEREIISYRLEDQETAPPSIRKAYPETALQFLAILPSASVYPARTLSTPT